MQVILTKPWKNHQAGSVLDVSEGIRDDILRLGVGEDFAVKAPEVQKGYRHKAMFPERRTK